MRMVNEWNNVLNFEVLAVVVVQSAVCCYVKPCIVNEIASVSEEPATPVSRLENEDVRFIRNVGTFLPLFVAFHRRETLVCQSRKGQLFESCSRSEIEKNEVGGACSAYEGRGEACTGFWW
jgi:hypothetical protein